MDMNKILWKFFRACWLFYPLDFFEDRMRRYFMRSPRGLELKAEEDKMTAEFDEMNSFFDSCLRSCEGKHE